jgi:hypothetical protein
MHYKSFLMVLPPRTQRKIKYSFFNSAFSALSAVKIQRYFNFRIIIILSFLFITFFGFSAPTKLIFIEQYYKLYESNLYSTAADHKRNVFWLENALKMPNIHPSMAIVITNTWEEYVKYKLLLRFHINFLLTKEYVDWGWEYDKQDVVFYNMEWAEKIKSSFEIARTRYLAAKIYWEETKKWSKEAAAQNVHIGWEQIEDLNWKIDNSQFDYSYDEVIAARLKDLDDKIKKIDDYMKNGKK